MKGTSILENLVLPLSQDVLAANDFFTLYPPDGGGGFILQQQLGSRNDLDIAARITQKDILKDFGTLPALDYHKFEFWSTIEKSCWLNRLYFIVPLARAAYLKKDKDMARLVVDVLLHFQRTQLAPATAKEAQDLFAEVHHRCTVEYNQGTVQSTATVPYQWYDFQPASRVIHGVNALWFLQDFDIFTEGEIQELRQFIDTNARVIADQEDVLPNEPGNHQALRGLALLYAGALFKNERYLKKGREIVAGHADFDFGEDGLLNENSPTYHCFETWILRDSCYLAKNNGFKLPPKVSATLKKAAAAMQVVCRPDGRAFLINDGCNLDLRPLLQTLPVKQKAPKDMTILKTAQIYTRSKKGWLALMDGSNQTGKFSHYHAGKNGLNLWYKGRPFIVDSGCCNYDAPEFATYFKTPEAHSTVLIDNQGDGKLRGMYEWLKWSQLYLMPLNDDYIISILQSSMPNWKDFYWQRGTAFQMGKNGKRQFETFVVHDSIAGMRHAAFTHILNLHPDVHYDILDTGDVVFENHGVKIYLRFLAETINVTEKQSALLNRLSDEDMKELEKFRAVLDVTCHETRGYYCDDLEIMETSQIRFETQGKTVSTKMIFSELPLDD